MPEAIIALLDPPDVIRKKISRATTDSGREVVFDPAKKPEVSNLMSIYAECADMTLQEIEAPTREMYGRSRRNWLKWLSLRLNRFKQRYREIRESGELADVLDTSARRVQKKLLLKRWMQ